MDINYTPNSREAHDLDIIELFSILKRSNAANNHLEDFIYHVHFHCQEIGKDFETCFKTGRILLIHPGNSRYKYFLARQLSLIRYPFIPKFLDHQKKIFKLKTCDLTDDIIMSQVSWMSVGDVDARLEKILKWQDNNKDAIKSNALTLQWVGNKKQLNDLSKDLHLRKFTDLPTDFEKAFLEHKRINWKNEPEYLAYLLYKLYNHSSEPIKVKRGAIYKEAQQLFYDNSQKVVKKINLRDLIHNVTKRYPDSYVKLRERVESIVAEFIK